MEINDGWFQLIRDLCTEITAVYAAGNQKIDLVVDQVKQKYGGLCFYYHRNNTTQAVDRQDDSPRIEPGGPDIDRSVWEIVQKYEEMSEDICEVCGKPGCLRNDLVWMMTLCREHYRSHTERA